MNTLEKNALADRAYEIAASYELDYGCCPQCVLSAVQDTAGVIEDQTIKAAHGLAGGGGLLGQGTCGALTGGLMALSSKKGRARDKFDKGRFINNYDKCRMLVEKFRKEFGGITCEDLQKQFTGKTFNLWNHEEYAQFDKDRGYKCAHTTGTVTRWVMEMI